MNKLLAANFARLWKNKVFWMMMAAILIYAVLFMLHSCRQAAMDTMAIYNFALDHYYFNFAPLVGLFCAVFTSLFVGTEYSDGTIRNKLIVGHSRAKVYLANLLVSFVATLMFMAVWAIGALVGIPTLGTWQMGVTSLMTYLLLAVLFIAALAAVFTLVSMACSSKAASAVLSILLFLGLLVCASMIYNSLAEPEMYSNMVLTEEGVSMGDPLPNPDYISGSLREVAQFAIDFLPTGQGIQMANLEIAHPVRMGLSSVIITVVVTLGGLLMFRKKDLR